MQASNNTSSSNISSSKTNNNDVTVEVSYTVDNGVRPWMYNRALTLNDQHKEQFGGTNEMCMVTLRDGRGNTSLTLDAGAFEFVEQTTSLSNEDFYQLATKDAHLKRTYYDEMKELIKKHSGAEEVVVFSHQVRNEQKFGPGAAGYAHGIHVDYAPSSAEGLFQIFAGKLGDDKYKNGRFVIYNAWRSISETPMQQDPLAVCDARSLVEPDFIMADFFMEDRPSFEQYRLASENHAKHQWYYLPQMTRDEVIIFKQYDSDTSKISRACFHTAVSLPNVPVDAPPRESFEVRAIAFFPDNKPNTN